VNNFQAIYPNTCLKIKKNPENTNCPFPLIFPKSIGSLGFAKYLLAAIYIKKT